MDKKKKPTVTSFFPSTMPTGEKEPNKELKVELIDTTNSKEDVVKKSEYYIS